MKKVLEDMVAKPNVKLLAITKRYFFEHVTKTDQKTAQKGQVPKDISLFVEMACNTGLQAHYYYFGENGTGVEITEAVEQTP